VGEGKLIDPARMRKVWVSPRQRAQRTFELLFEGPVALHTRSKVDLTERSLDHIGQYTEAGGRVMPEEIFAGGRGCVVVTEQIAEWDYGDYEGLNKEQVRKLRFARGLLRGDEEWSVWRDGCERGE
jgi:sedoheptulose-bisphosphatase